jgi:transposase
MSNRNPQPAGPAEPALAYAAFVGIDWADQKHKVCLLDGPRQTETDLEHTPEAIADWAMSLRKQFGGLPVAVAVEQARGGLVHALMQYDHLVLFPINPKQAARYREALSVGGKKDDPFDAKMLARFLRDHLDTLRPWKPDDALTRELARLCELRRNIVESRKQTVQQLTATLKQYFPQALRLADPLHGPLALELLRRWPTLKALQRAHPGKLKELFGHYQRNEEKVAALVAEIRTFQPLTSDAAIIQPNGMFVELLIKQIEQLNSAVERFDRQIEKLFAQHEDAAIFKSLPGAGAALAPRLCTAMGTDRDRFGDASNVQSYVGIAPVTKRSGKSCHVQRRYACPKFLRQTFHEFADHARKWSPWSKAYYQSHRNQGAKHHAAVRALAFKWIRIIFRLWKNRTTYDEAQYLVQLQKTHSPLAIVLKTS